jgi:hypothetical protein
MRNDTSSIEHLNSGCYCIPRFSLTVERNLDQPSRNGVSRRENPLACRVADLWGIAAVQATDCGAFDRGAFTGQTIAPVRGAGDFLFTTYNFFHTRPYFDGVVFQCALFSEFIFLRSLCRQTPHRSGNRNWGLFALREEVCRELLWDQGDTGGSDLSGFGSLVIP